MGTNPTFDGDARRVEAYVIDAPDGFDVYGQQADLDFVARLRGMERFAMSRPWWRRWAGTSSRPATARAADWRADLAGRARGVMTRSGTVTAVNVPRTGAIEAAAQAVQMVLQGEPPWGGPQWGALGGQATWWPVPESSDRARPPLAFW